MCGIAGYMGKGTRDQLASMLTATSHRGPDARGIFIDENVGLGQNRLSIIDLSQNGRQPMFDSEKSICIVFGGEIYNYQDIKKQLSEFSFTSKTDTEVLLYAYKKWGIKCLEKLNGMFSFVIYDKKKNLLFGARDRIGEKPLKYYIGKNIFAFSSEIKGLLPILPKRPELDPIAINHYLTLQYVPFPYTGFKHIFKLPPAHYFIYKNEKLQIQKYWSLSFSKKENLSEGEWEDVLLKKLRESVKARLISDVPLGAFLSGGIDSSAVVALMAEHSKEKIKTFSIGFNDSKFDESYFARIVAKQYHTDHSSIVVTNKMMSDVFEKLSDYYDEPFADNSAIPTFLLSKLARKKVTVALSGDGGDENFAGYERYNIVAFSNLYKSVPKEIKDLLVYGTGFIRSIANTTFTERSYIYTKTFSLPYYRKYLFYNSFFNNEIKRELFSRDFKAKVARLDTFNMYKKMYSPKLSDIDNALLFDIMTYLPEDLLYKTDIASMANSLEIRSPFLNHELFELTAQIPFHFKIKLFNKKYIFKKLLLKNKYLPKEIIYRKKRGFTAPINKWLKGSHRGLLLEKMSSKKFINSNIFDQHKLKDYVSDYLDGRQISSNNIFALLSLSSWIQKYL